MAREAPLLTRPPSEGSDDRDTAEEDALLTGQRMKHTRRSRWQLCREISLFIWAFAATAVVIVLAVLYEKSHNQWHPNPISGSNPVFADGKRNLIFMISDGMGPTSLSLTRSYKQVRDGLPETEALVIDGHLIGQSRTRSSSSLITDSAAGATAFSCGKKTYNGAISTLPDHSPCGTVMEAAKKAGYMTGLVVTTRITDATPACFAAHVNKREQEDIIAQQLIGEHPLGRVVDLMLGAGRCHFLPNTTAGSCRGDANDIIAAAREKGFTYMDNRGAFDRTMQKASIELPLMGLFADHDIPYEVDRQHEQDVYPSLSEMSQLAMKALSAATKDSEKGFFLMIEGSRIDHAGHANDPVAQVHEVLAYDKAFSMVLEFLHEDDVQGVMISTSDHETGGLGTARQLQPYVYPEYIWFPDVLANASHSAEWLTIEYFRHLSLNHGHGGASGHTVTPHWAEDVTTYVRTALKEHLGVHDATEQEVMDLVKNPSKSPYMFADIISRRSQTGWSTHGHSAADVNIYASKLEDAVALSGNHENTEVGEFLRNFLDVDVDAITKELHYGGVDPNSFAPSGHTLDWMGPKPDDGERLDGGAHIGHYEGDYKKYKRCDICGI